MTAGSVSRDNVAGFKLHDIDWHGIADRVIWVPEVYRRGTLDERTVRRILRCTERSLAALRESGLTPVKGEAGTRYDACDIRNAALYSGTGATEVEAAMRPVLSRVRGRASTPLSHRHWSYHLSISAPDPATGAEYAVHPPSDGTDAEGEVTLTNGQRPRRSGKRILVPGGTAIRGVIRTSASSAELLSPTISGVVDKFLESGFRWHFVPAELKHDPQAASAVGMGNCEMLSLVLCDQLTAVGLAAEIYRGWVAGVRAMPHCWIEVYDIDGKPKIIDPGVLTIAKYLGPLEATDYRSLIGTKLEVIIPTRCTLQESIATAITHRANFPCDVRFQCVAVPAGDAGTRRHQ